jgi:hypothetical protein
MTTRLLQSWRDPEVNLTLTTFARLCEGFELDAVQLIRPVKVTLAK